MSINFLPLKKPAHFILFSLIRRLCVETKTFGASYTEYKTSYNQYKTLGLAVKYRCSGDRNLNAVVSWPPTEVVVVLRQCGRS